MPTVSPVSHSTPEVEGVVDGGVVSRFRRLTNDGSQFLCPLLLAFLALLVTYWMSSRWYDTDQWFFLSTGREIVTNCFLRENPFSVWPGMRIVVQQWLFCVMVWLEWSLGGWLLVGGGLLVRLLLLLACIWTYMRVVAPRLTTTDRVFLLVVTFPILLEFERNNPRVYDKLIVFAILAVLESYARDGQKRRLALLPALALLHVNLHSSLVVLDVLLAVIYLFPDVRRARGVLGGTSVGAGCPSVGVLPYRRRPILLAILGMCAMAPLNPYGFDGVAYLFRSMGSASYGDFIAEMLPAASVGTIRGGEVIFALWLTYAMVTLAALVASASRGRYVQQNALLFLGFLLAGFLQERNFTFMGIATVAALAQWLDAQRGVAAELDPVFVIPSREASPRLTRTCWLALPLLVVAFSTIALVQPHTFASTGFPKAYLKLPEEMARAAGTGDDRVLTYANYGGYLEFKGFRVSVDTRPELWDHGVAGGSSDHYRDYVDCLNESDPMAEGSHTSKYVASADFDWASVNKGDNFNTYLRGHAEEWRRIGEDGDCVFYQRIR